MRLQKNFLIVLVSAAVAGCSAASGTGASGPASAAAGTTTRSAAASSTRPAASSTGSAASSTQLAPSITPKVEAALRPTVTHFYSVYLGREVAASWDLLAPAVKKQISMQVWTGVHDACRPVNAGEARVIKAVTVFGNSAIVTIAIAGIPAKAGVSEDIFSYAQGRWGYSPTDIGIYRHGSITADVAAAKAAGICGSWTSF